MPGDSSSEKNPLGSQNSKSQQDHTPRKMPPLDMTAFLQLLEGANGNVNGDGKDLKPKAYEPTPV